MICTPYVKVPSHIVIGGLGGSKETYQGGREIIVNRWWRKQDTRTRNRRRDDI